MKRIIKWIVIVILILIIGGVAFLYINLDHIIKQVVETEGTQQLNVPTTLEGVSLQLFKGSLELSNFAVGSPAGFSSPQMLSLGGLSVDTGGITKLRDRPVHITTIRIDQPKLVIEQSGGKLNFKELIDGLPSQAADQSTPPAAAPEQSSTQSAVKLVIDDLAVADAQVVIHPGIPGVQPEYNLSIPAIDVKNIGNSDGAENGVALKDVVVLIITQMTAKAAESSKLPPEVGALLTGNLDAIKGKLTNEAQTRLSGAAQKYVKQLPPGSAQPANDLVNQGFGILRQATSQPANK
jgi:uncharacterized protein involved in outer membrane biogenesis